MSLNMQNQQYLMIISQEIGQKQAGPIRGSGPLQVLENQSFNENKQARSGPAEEEREEE